MTIVAFMVVWTENRDRKLHGTRTQRYVKRGVPFSIVNKSLDLIDINFSVVHLINNSVLQFCSSLFNQEWRSLQRYFLISRFAEMLKTIGK